MKHWKAGSRRKPGRAEIVTPERPVPRPSYEAVLSGGRRLAGLVGVGRSERTFLSTRSEIFREFRPKGTQRSSIPSKHQTSVKEEKASFLVNNSRISKLYVLTGFWHFLYRSSRSPNETRPTNRGVNRRISIDIREHVLFPLKSIMRPMSLAYSESLHR